MIKDIPNPRNPKRTPSVIVDEDGSKWGCGNGNILSELFARSPIYRRETPDLVEVKDSDGTIKKRIGPNHNGERVIRVFVDAETAMMNCAKIVGYKPEKYEWTNPRGKKEIRRHDDHHKNFNRKLDKFIERLNQPDAGAIEASERVFQEVDEKLDMETLTARIDPGPVGGSPNIGAYLIGSPNSMWRQTSPMTQEGNVRVFVDLSSSAGYSNDGIRGRGIAMLALVRCIQRLRPVELWVGTTGTAAQWSPNSGRVNGVKVGGRHMAHTCFMMRLGTAPVDVNLASRMLADPFGGRGFCYNAELTSVGHPIGESGGLAWSSIPFHVTVGATDQDICFGPMYSGQPGAIGKGVSPVDWVKAELKAWLDKSGNSAAAQMIG